MKENTKRYVKLSILLYIVILSVALVGTLAWFLFEQSATIKTEEDSRIIAGEYLEICFDDGDDDPNNDKWGIDVSVSNSAQFPDVSLTPDGTVWYPVSLEEDDGLIYGEAGRGVYENVTGLNGYLVKIPLKVRASTGINVYLDQSSKLEGVDLEKTDASGVDGSVFSRDAVAGAARVAFFDESGAKMVWVPNERYELISSSEGALNIVYDGNPEDEYKYLNVVDGIVNEGSEYGTWDSDLIALGTDKLASDGNTNEATPLLEFTKAGEEKKLVIYIWIEGSDREANTVLSGGSFKYDLKLTGIVEKAPSAVNVDDVAYKNGQLVYASSGAEVGSEILYSYDGNVWTPYSTGNPDLAKGNSVLYVRAKETAAERAGLVKEIAIK